MRIGSNQKAIIVGAGPSLFRFKHLERLKKIGFPGVIITTDKMLKDLLKMDIVPHYVITGENTKKITRFFQREDNESFDFVKKFSKDIICVMTHKTHLEVRHVILTNTWKDCIMLDDDIIEDSSNVGLQAWLFAWKYMKCKEVVLIGMDNAKEEGWKPSIDPEDGSFKTIEHPDFKTKQILDPVYQLFRQEFLDIAKTKPCLTVNCTGGGALFGTGIVCKKFEEYL